MFKISDQVQAVIATQIGGIVLYCVREYFKWRKEEAVRRRLIRMEATGKQVQAELKENTSITKDVQMRTEIMSTNINRVREATHRAFQDLMNTRSPGYQGSSESVELDHQAPEEEGQPRDPGGSSSGSIGGPGPDDDPASARPETRPRDT